MLAFFMIAILGSMVGLVLYELVSEARESHHKLEDHYHE